MRTTVNIPDDVLAAIKREALSRGVSLGSMVEMALRRLLSEPRTGSRTLDLPVYGGSGLRPGVDLRDKESLAELLDAAP